jgi:hypothetical protein
LSYENCHGIKRILAGHALKHVTLSRRARDRLAKLRSEFCWVSDQEETVVVRDSSGAQNWWTFAGIEANTWLSIGLGDLAAQVVPGDLSLRLSPGTNVSELTRRLREIRAEKLHLGDHVANGRLSGSSLQMLFPQSARSGLSSNECAPMTSCIESLRGEFSSGDDVPSLA